MKLMVGFLGACFLIGLVFANKRPASKALLLFVICVFVCLIYFFVSQI